MPINVSRRHVGSRSRCVIAARSPVRPINGEDGAGSLRLTRAYAVPLPIDTQAPTLAWTTPATTTIISSVAPTITIPIAGHVSDDRGPVTVLLEGRVITSALDGTFATPLEAQRGLNGVSLTVIDADGERHRHGE